MEREGVYFLCKKKFAFSKTYLTFFMVIRQRILPGARKTANFAPAFGDAEIIMVNYYLNPLRLRQSCKTFFPPLSQQHPPIARIYQIQTLLNSENNSFINKCGSEALANQPNSCPPPPPGTLKNSTQAERV